ncbi:MAG: ATP-dependent DNA helicase RecG [Phycisphaerales bacterium]
MARVPDSTAQHGSAGVVLIRPDQVELTTPIDRLAGLKRDHAAGLYAMGITNVGKLVAHLPMRHEREEAEAKIAELEVGQIVSARGEVTATRLAGFGRKQRFEVVLTDETGRLDLVFFNQTYLKSKVHPGTTLRVQGKLSKRGPQLQLANPKIEYLDDDEQADTRESRLRPVYPASEAVNSRAIEAAVEMVLPRALEQIADHLSDDYRRARELPELRRAYRMMHRPDNPGEVIDARRRLAYDELLLLQLGVQLKRAHLRRTLQSPPLRFDDEIDARIRERLPFTLTPSQDKVVKQIVGDISTSVPTNRLVQGDVGSGKTAVALYAMLMAVNSGHQAALMAPTELLSEQHYLSISTMLAGSRVRIALLTGSLTPSERASVLAQIDQGDVDLVIGTHALLTEKVTFKSLAVAIIDEQHRFGVHQRASLRVKGAVVDAQSEGASEQITPHVLVMTATPIPRTIGLTLFGDLDLSTIDGLPPGRKPITTRVVDPIERESVYTWVAERIDAGEQAFVVVPAIDTGESAGDGGLKDLRSVHKELENGPLAGRNVAAIHGRLKRETREHVMERFRKGKIDCLVATTVIEVGVDVPNATVMVVEHAERFGLAQLHQLRGRVGRGSKGGHCVLIGNAEAGDASERLKVMTDTTSGFELAERDLEIRGPGEVFGARQSGMPPLLVADLMRDRELLAMARKDAAAWIDEAPRLSRPTDTLIRRRLMKQYGEALGIGDVG